MIMSTTQNEHALAAGHAGCMAFARLALILVFIANVMAYVTEPRPFVMVGMLAAALGAGLSYLAQTMFNAYGGLIDNDDIPAASLATLYRRGMIGQVCAVVLFVLSGLIAWVAA